jgi:hypothetical protein
VRSREYPGVVRHSVCQARSCAVVVEPGYSQRAPFHWATEGDVGMGISLQPRLRAQPQMK